MILLVGITGKAGAGKDTFANFLKTHLESVMAVETLAFADPLKQYCMVKFGLTHEQVYTQEGKREVIPWLGVSVRELLQREGTENTKPFWGDDFWVKRMEMEVNKLHENTIVLIPDTRFQDEALWILNRGGVILSIDRPDLDNLQGTEAAHASEAGLPYYLQTYQILNNGSLQEFGAQAMAVAERLVTSYGLNWS